MQFDIFQESLYSKSKSKLDKPNLFPYNITGYNILIRIERRTGLK